MQQTHRLSVLRVGFYINPLQARTSFLGPSALCDFPSLQHLTNGNHTFWGKQIRTLKSKSQVQEEDDDDDEDEDPYEGQDAAAAIKNADTILTPAGKKAVLGGNAKVEPGLYVIGTPVGNLSDITLRALHILKSADVVCCEDTRVTQRMLRRYNIIQEASKRISAKIDYSSPKKHQNLKQPGIVGPKLISFHKHSHPRKIDDILGNLIEGKQIVAVVSDSGTPLISDPGANLVEEAHKAKVPVFCVPGPSMPTSALSVSGFPSERFIFEGFLPKKPGQKGKLLRKLAKQERTVVFFESPFRIDKTLTACIEAWGENHEAVMVREMTKIHEEVARGTLSSLLEKAKKKAKGEFTIVIGPKVEEKKAKPTETEEKKK